MVAALFDINLDGGDQGFSATNSQVLTLRLRQQPPIGVATVLYQVFNPAGFNADLGIAANPPRSSLGAPTLTIVGATSGQAVSPATVDGTVTITMPASGSHSYIVRCLVNGGFRTLPNGQQVLDPTLIHERGVYIPTVLGARKVVCTELRQFSDGGWADALAALPDFIVADHTIPLIKLPLAAAAPSVVGASANGNMSELPISTFLRGVGLTMDSAGRLAPRTRPRMQSLKDSFVTGNTTSGSIGELGWNLNGVGTPVLTRVDVASLGSSNKLTLTTSAALNDRSSLTLGETETRKVAALSGNGQLNLMQCIWKLPSLTNVRAFFGLSSNFATEPSAAVDALGIYYDSAVSPNYQIISRSSSVGSPVNTGVAVPSNVAELITILQPTLGTFQFYSGNTLLGTISSGLTANALNAGFRVETLTTVLKSLHIGYFDFEASSAAAFDDDTFLEA